MYAEVRCQFPFGSAHAWCMSIGRQMKWRPASRRLWGQIQRWRWCRKVSRHLPLFTTHQNAMRAATLTVALTTYEMMRYLITVPNLADNPSRPRPLTHQKKLLSLVSTPRPYYNAKKLKIHFSNYHNSSRFYNKLDNHSTVNSSGSAIEALRCWTKGWRPSAPWFTRGLFVGGHPVGARGHEWWRTVVQVSYLNSLEIKRLVKSSPQLLEMGVHSKLVTNAWCAGLSLLVSGFPNLALSIQFLVSNYWQILEKDKNRAPTLFLHFD